MDKRLAQIENGIIVRCYYGPVETVDGASIIYAEEPWIQEGLNLEQARLDYEQMLANEEDKRDKSKQVDLHPDTLTFINAIKHATPQQINTYINNNVTDLASAREVLKKITLVLSRVLRRI